MMETNIVQGISDNKLFLRTFNWVAILRIAMTVIITALWYWFVLSDWSFKDSFSEFFAALTLLIYPCAMYLFIGHDAYINRNKYIEVNDDYYVIASKKFKKQDLESISVIQGTKIGTAGMGVLTYWIQLSFNKGYYSTKVNIMSFFYKKTALKYGKILAAFFRIELIDNASERLLEK